MGIVCMCSHVWVAFLVCESCVWMSVTAVASMADYGLEPALIKGLSITCHSDSRLLLQLQTLILFFPQ